MEICQHLQFTSVAYIVAQGCLGEQRLVRQTKGGKYFLINWEGVSYKLRVEFSSHSLATEVPPGIARLRLESPMV